MKSIVVQAEAGKVLVIGQQQNADVIVKGTPSAIKVYQCSNIKVLPDAEFLTVAGTGAGARAPLISILQSPDCEVMRAHVRGLQSDASKAAWYQDVPNGIVVCGESHGFVLSDAYLEFVHYGVQLKARNWLLQRVKTQCLSADAVQAIDPTDVEIDSLYSQFSLGVLPHTAPKGQAQVHRDWIQGAATAAQEVMRNIRIRDSGCWFPDVDPQGNTSGWQGWVATADGLMLSDGVVDGLVMSDCLIQVNALNGIAMNDHRNIDIDPRSVQLMPAGQVRFA